MAGISYRRPWLGEYTTGRRGRLLTRVVQGPASRVQRPGFGFAIARHDITALGRFFNDDYVMVRPLAAEHGHWQGLTSKGTLALEGTYLVMWRKSADGVWQIRSELFVVLACHGEDACSAYRATAKK